MTRAFWNAQFRFSEILPDFGDWLERMDQDSAVVAGPFERARYGDDPRQWVEWTGGTGGPGVLPVIVHGGYWRALEAERHRFLVAPFRAHGGAVANVEYRLMPHVRLRDVVGDVRAALGLLARRFPQARFVLVGHSAGAHLALAAMADTALSARTRGIIALSGVYDLAPVALSFLQDELSLTPDEVTAFTIAPSDSRPPTLFVSGGRETPEFLRGAALLSARGPSAWTVLEGAHHMSLPHAAAAVADRLISSLPDLKAPS